MLSPPRLESVGELFQRVGRHYVAYVNHAYRRTGTLWEGCYKASLINSARYLLSCYRYIELNPVRADMVRSPACYPWSSYHANAQGKVDAVLQPHPLYLELSCTEDERQKAYRALFASALDTSVLKGLRDCLQSGTPLGYERFRAQIEQALNIKVGHVRRGRPAKKKV